MGQCADWVLGDHGNVLIQLFLNVYVFLVEAPLLIQRKGGETSTWCRCPKRNRSKVTNIKSPTTLVTITDRRLVIMQFESIGLTN